MHYLLSLLFFFTCCANLCAQTYVSVERQSMIPAATIGLFVPITPEFDVINYKVVYNTVDAEGRPTTASGLLSIPADTSQARPMIAYMHGTAVQRDQVPSNSDTRERFLVYALATSGYITVTPDYIGLGESEGYHPYVHADSESQSGRDLLRAARQYLDEEGIRYSEDLFVTGYSQGGHAAQALQRDLQADPGPDSLIVTAGAHLSGPYSISEVMRQATLTTDRPTLPGFIVYTYVSYSNVYGLYDSLGEAFVSPYLEVIDSFNRELIDGERFNAQLDTFLRLQDDRLVDMFQDSVIQQIEDNDPESPIIQALRDNDTYNWAPTAPTLLYYCTEDDQVPYQNAILADSVMRELGSTSVVLESGGPLDHGQCIEPAMRRTLQFFESYTTSTRGQALVVPEFIVHPNPVQPGRSLFLDRLPTADYRYELLDAAGRTAQRGSLHATRQISLDDDLHSGMYVLRLLRGDGNYLVRKVVLRR